MLEERVAVRAPNGRDEMVVFASDYGPIERAAIRQSIPVSLVLELLLVVPFLVLVPAIRRVVRQTRRDFDDAQAFALRDTLTGLPNRRLFEERLQHALAQSRRNGTGIAVMIVDLDRFKEVNDTLGHAAGDAALMETAVRLTSLLRDSDTVARFGGDEFAIIVDGSGIETVHDTVHRMHEALEMPIEQEGTTFAVGASIGVALHPDHGATAGLLVKHADTAMYQAKRAGLGWAVYDPHQASGDDERQLLTGELARAVERNEIVVHYQPTLDVRSGCAAGVEALLRWNHPSRGLLPAERFMPFSARAGVRTQLHELALVEAVAQAGAWRRSGLDTSVAINFDVRSLLDRGLPQRFERLLVREGADPAQIEAEISEVSLLSDIDRVRSVAAALSSMGVRLIVDDFGADHSSLRSLSHLPIEKLKIGRSFLTRASMSQRERIVLGATVELAHNLGLLVVVAGVEDDEALDLVRDLGVDYVQGYHVGTPMPPEAIEKLFLSRRGLAVA